MLQYTVTFLIVAIVIVMSKKAICYSVTASNIYVSTKCMIDNIMIKTIEKRKFFRSAKFFPAIYVFLL